jgi:biuret amidohydrolase
MAIIEAEPYAFDLDPARASLVIIDMQRDFLEPGGFGAALGNDVSLLRRTIAPTSRLLERARAAALTIIHTRRGSSSRPCRFAADEESPRPARCRYR